MFLIAIAAAAPGEIVDDGTGVQSIQWARPFHLAEPQRYSHADPAREVQDGWLLQLEVDPKFMMARQIVPVLWIGDDLAVRTNWNASCAVVWVPGEHDFASERVYFGSTTLPERMDGERRDLDHSAARAVGISPLPADRIEDMKDKPLVFLDLGGLMEAAAVRAQGCAKQEEHPRR